MGAWASRARQSVLQTIPIVKPMIDERKAKVEEYGEEWTEKPVSCSELRSLPCLWVVPKNIVDARVRTRQIFFSGFWRRVCKTTFLMKGL